jgi:hypothetical protein
VPQYIWKVLYPDSDVHWLPLEPGHPPRNALDEALGWLALPVCVNTVCWVVGVFVLDTGWRALREVAVEGDVEGELEETKTVVVATLNTHYVRYFPVLEAMEENFGHFHTYYSPSATQKPLL